MVAKGIYRVDGVLHFQNTVTAEREALLREMRGTVAATLAHVLGSVGQLELSLTGQTMVFTASCCARRGGLATVMLDDLAHAVKTSIAQALLTRAGHFMIDNVSVTYSYP